MGDGAFEDLQSMREAGWRHFEHPQEGVTSGVDLSPKLPHGGHTSLRIWAAPSDPKHKPSAVETAPAWVTSPTVHVSQGSVVQIQGWLSVPKGVSGADGLLVIDSLGGEAMAIRATSTGSWQQFTVYRAVPRSGPMTLTFALCGLGEALIDDVSVQVVERGQAAPMQPPMLTRPAGGASTLGGAAATSGELGRPPATMRQTPIQ